MDDELGLECGYFSFLARRIIFVSLTLVLRFPQLVVVHADLIGHLKALKDYFLLAKGDFFQASPTLQSNLNFVFTADKILGYRQIISVGEMQSPKINSEGAVFDIGGTC